MKTYILIICAFVSICIITGVGCRYDETVPVPKSNPTNIILYNKPLDTIQHYIQGKWKLQYSYGGISVHKEIDTHNSYMILSPTHITMGNDLTGIVVDTTIVWVKADIGNRDSTYLLSYSWSGYLWPEYNIVDQLKYDTLILRQYVDDGLEFFYKKY